MTRPGTNDTTFFDDLFLSRVTREDVQLVNIFCIFRFNFSDLCPFHCLLHSNVSG